MALSQKSNQKLLLLGTSTDTKYALKYAKELGVWTIVTDYRPAEQCEEKRAADEYWMEDVKDVDALERKCRAENVTAVYAGNNEFCLDQTKELCKRLGLPFYASEEGWMAARNKKKFKQHCIACGLDVSKQYMLTEEFRPQDLELIRYPVIVKPADADASRGLSLCRTQEELFPAYEKALQNSPSKNVVVEDYTDGIGGGMDFMVEDGEPVLISIDSSLEMPFGGRDVFVFSPERQKLPYEAEYVAMAPKIRALFKRMGCKNGHIFLQFIRTKEGRFVFNEMGYRVDGVGYWTLQETMFGYSSVKRMVDLALGRPFPRDWKAKLPSVRTTEQTGPIGAVYFIYAMPGKIVSISGLDLIEKEDGLTVVMDRYRVGDEIMETYSMVQMAYYITILADNPRGIVKKVKWINDILKVCDATGRNLLVPYEDYDCILSGYEGE